MMGLHQSFSVSWGLERMDNYSTELDFEAMLSPLPTDLTPSRVSGASWGFSDASQREEQQRQIQSGVLNLAVPPELESDPTVLLPNMPFERAGRYPSVQQQPMIHPKLEKPEVVPNRTITRRSLPTDLTFSHSDGAQTWTAIDCPPKVLHPYDRVGGGGGGVGGGQTSEASELRTFSSFPGRNSTAPFPGRKSAAPALNLFKDNISGRQQLGNIFGDGDESDDEFFLEDQDYEEDEIMPSLEITEKSNVQQAEALTKSLRLIKHSVRSNSKEDENCSVQPSAAPESVAYDNPGDTVVEGDKAQMTQLKRPMDSSQVCVVSESKRSRGSEHESGWPFDVVNNSSDVRGVNEPNETRRHSENAEREAPFGANESSQMEMRKRAVPSELPLMDMNESGTWTSQCTDRSIQQTLSQRPLIDVNLSIQEMEGNLAIQHMEEAGEDVAANAFKELFRLVGASRTGSTHPVHDSEDSTRDIRGDYQRSEAQPDPADRLVSPELPFELESRTPFSADTLGSPELPFELESQTPFSPESVVCGEDAGKKVSCAEVVLFEPKPEPQTDQWRENACSSVIQVKQESPPAPNICNVVSIRPTQQYDYGVGSSRDLIKLALSSFEMCRQHMIRDPLYGRTAEELEGGFSKRNRADLRAACLMRQKGYWLNEDRPIGEVQGVAVGDCFRYRIEMAVIGLHRAVQAGIATIPSALSRYGMPVAPSVVIGVADPYQDDSDMGDTVVYSGQGGLCNKTKEAQDQTLTRGNLALKNSFDLKLPVRLIRGHRDQQGITGITYSYDGLYQITEMNFVRGVNGKMVYKFTMARLPGQAPLRPNGYPSPVGSMRPVAQQTENALCWSAPEPKSLYLESGGKS